jgi:hypothetical protein
MSAEYNHLSDLRFCVSTTPEEEYGEAVADGAFDKEFKISNRWPDERFRRTLFNLCGGEHPTGAEDEQRDVNIPIDMLATPDASAWLMYYAFGGGTAYGTTGAGPYTHTFKPRTDSYTPASASIVGYYKAPTPEYFKWRGAQVAEWRLGASIDGQKFLRHTGSFGTAGEREELGSFTPADCVGEKPYRIGDTTVQLKAYGGGSYLEGLILRAFEWSIIQGLVGEDEADRTGLYISRRVRGDRIFRARLSVLGNEGDVVDDLFQENTEVTLNTISTNRVSNRVLSVFGGKMVILSKTSGYSTSAQESTHEFELAGLLDETSDTTEANSPFYATIQTGTDTYAATPP